MLESEEQCDPQGDGDKDLASLISTIWWQGQIKAARRTVAETPRMTSEDTAATFVSRTDLWPGPHESKCAG